MEKAKSGWVKVNMDNDLVANPGSAGASGVIRDELKIWKKGFCNNLSTANNIVAELYGIIYGIKFSMSGGIQKSFTGGDSLSSIELIGEDHTDSCMPNLIKKIKLEMKRNWGIKDNSLMNRGEYDCRNAGKDEFIAGIRIEDSLVTSRCY